MLEIDFVRKISNQVVEIFSQMFFGFVINITMFTFGVIGFEKK
ncbi:hypothetical protein BV134_79 [Haemophilus influenzae]|nr:hypothetical protein BV131_79 [Haemophilus influenzae]AVJ04176.1 hypothetical protein BV134_79 [Haemophilus influenzae]